jgi:hypothetical protein
MRRGRKNKAPKRVLRLSDLDYAKGEVLNTLGSPESKRAYQLAIDDFVIWYCSEPRLAFNKTVVLRYRLELAGRSSAHENLTVVHPVLEPVSYPFICPDCWTGAKVYGGGEWSLSPGVKPNELLAIEDLRRLRDSPASGR